VEITDKYTDVRKAFNEEVLALRFLKDRTTNVVQLRAHFIHEIDTAAKGYMIFELADSTLDKYMKINSPPATKEGLHYLLRNASGLASCLSAFHNPQKVTRDEEEGLKRIGIHRDLVRLAVRSLLACIANYRVVFPSSLSRIFSLKKTIL
jgi:hypothetical protein